MKHTKGPWKVESDNFIYAQDPHIEIAAVKFSGNSQLIAAAPDLLEALKQLIQAPSLNEDSIDGHDFKAIQTALKAIAKAEGQGPAEGEGK